MSVLGRVRTNAPDLPPALARIAQYVLDSPGQVIYQTVTGGSAPGGSDTEKEKS